MQLDREYDVALQRLDDGANGAVEEAADLVEIASEADLDTRPRQHSQIRFRRRIARITCGQVILADALELQCRPAYISRPSVRAGQPGEYFSSLLLQILSATNCSFQRYPAPMPPLEILHQHLLLLDLTS